MAANPEQLQAAFSYCLNFARRMLKNTGSLLPFGAALSPSGEIRAVAGWNGWERPLPADMYRLISSALRKDAASNTIIGSAIAVDVTIPAEYEPALSDGIRVHLESDGYSRHVYVPYVLKTSGFMRSRRELVLSEPFSVDVDADVFGSR